MESIRGFEKRFMENAIGKKFIQRGELRLLILESLEGGRKYGYQIMRSISLMFKGMYTPSAGSVYPKLKQLEEEGLVKKGVERDKKIYELTKRGKKELERHKKYLDEIKKRFLGMLFGDKKREKDIVRMAREMGGIAQASIVAAKDYKGEDIDERVEKTIKMLEECKEKLRDIWDDE